MGHKCSDFIWKQRIRRPVPVKIKQRSFGVAEMEIMVIFASEKNNHIMTSIELRTSILTEIASILDNEELMKQTLAYLRKIRQKNMDFPCRFTVDELKKEIELSEDDDRHNRYYTTEELRKKHPLCNK